MIEIEEPILEGEGASLRHDVFCILVECTRDRGLQVFKEDLPRDSVDALATMVARRLAPRIGGRYVPKRDDEKELRNAAVVKAWEEGASREQLMRRFNISRRLSYNITGAAAKARKQRK